MRACLLIALLVSVGCGSPPTEPAPEWVAVAGTYLGPVAGAGASGQMSGTLALTLTQDEDHLGGTYQFTGVVSGGLRPGPVAASGTVVGVIEYRGTSYFVLTFYEPSCGPAISNAGVGYSAEPRALIFSYGDMIVCADPANGIVSDRSYSIGSARLDRQ